MEINNTQGLMAYTAVRSTQDNISTQNDRTAQSNQPPDSNLKGSQTDQKAFDVNISQEAKIQQTMATQPSKPLAETPPSEPTKPLQDNQQQIQTSENLGVNTIDIFA